MGEKILETVCNKAELVSGEECGENQDYWAPMIHDSDNDDDGDCDCEDVEPNKNNFSNNNNDDNVNDNGYHDNKKIEQTLNNSKCDMYIKKNEIYQVKENCKQSCSEKLLDEKEQKKCDDDRCELTDNYNNEENCIMERELNIGQDKETAKELKNILPYEKVNTVILSSNNDSEIKQINISEMDFVSDTASSKSCSIDIYKLDNHILNQTCSQNNEIKD